jgi:hypothetical protein
MRVAQQEAVNDKTQTRQQQRGEGGDSGEGDDSDDEDEQRGAVRWWGGSWWEAALAAEGLVDLTSASLRRRLRSWSVGPAAAAGAAATAAAGSMGCRHTGSSEGQCAPAPAHLCRQHWSPC